mgnify:CR=1 FL=1
MTPGRVRAGFGAVLLVVAASCPGGDARADDGGWTVLRADAVRSSGGATLSQRQDGAFVATGTNPDTDVYEVEASVADAGLVALRLEALPDPALPKGGAARSPNSNFCVSEVELEVAPPGRRTWERVEFGTAFATRADDHSARRAGDGDVGSHWVVRGTHGAPSVLVLVADAPFGFAGGTRLRVRVRQESAHKQHQLGCFRLAVTTSTAASDAYAPVRRPLAERVDESTWRGIQFLLGRQHPDGTWFSAQEPDRHLGMTALCAYALSKAGVPTEHATLQMALSYLETHPPHETYDAALRILWLTSLDPEGYRAQIERAAEVLRYAPGQYFAYELPCAAGDLSNHQFAVVALNALDTHGFPVERRTWERLADRSVVTQNADGSWGYRQPDAATPTMTLAGLAVAAACRAALERAKAPRRAIERPEAAVARALEYEAQHWYLRAPRSRGPLDRWFWYGCYGMERAAALAGVERFGAHDWYREVADVICEEQQDDGSWTNPWGEAERNTAFCLLTLARATASTGVPSIPARFEARWTNAGTCDLGVTALGAPGVTAYLTDVGAAAISRLAWPGEVRPRVLEVQWHLDGVPLGDPCREGVDSATSPARGPLPRCAVSFTVPRDGDHELRAVARVAPPDGGAPVDLAGTPLAIHVSGLVDADVLERMRLARAALPPGCDQIEASSSRDDGEFAPKRAFDRSESTRWVARADDPQPTLTATWRRPVPVAALRLLPALDAAHLRDTPTFDVPRHVRVRINGTDDHELDLGPEHLRDGATLRLPAPIRIRRLEVRIETRDPGEREKGQCGWREIALLGE